MTDSKPTTKTNEGIFWYLLGVITALIVIIVMVATGLFVAPKASVVPGESETTFNAFVKDDMVSNFGVPSWADVSCAYPPAWIPGTIFLCYAYNSNGREMGTLQIDIDRTLPGYLWNVYEAETFVRPYVHPDH